MTDCADLADNQRYRDFSTVFTPVACTYAGGTEDGCDNNCCFLNHAPNAPDKATIPVSVLFPQYFSPMAPVAFSRATFDPSKACHPNCSKCKKPNDFESTNANCYDGPCSGVPTFAGGLYGNLTAVVESDDKCQSPTLSVLEGSDECKTVSAGCDPSTSRACVPCCKGLVPEQVACSPIGGNNYGLYSCKTFQCPQGSTAFAGKCYCNNPPIGFDSPYCWRKDKKGGCMGSRDNTDSHFTFLCSGNAAVASCSEQTTVPAGVFYCAGTPSSDGYRSYTGTWKECTSDQGCTQTNNWAWGGDTTPQKNQNPSYCSWPPTESSFSWKKQHPDNHWL